MSWGGVLGVFWTPMFVTYQEKYMPHTCIACWRWGVGLGMNWLMGYNGVKGREWGRQEGTKA